MIISGLKKISSFIMAVSTVSLLTLGCSGNNDNSLSVSDNSHNQSASGFTYILQDGWKYCVNCRCLFWGPCEYQSACANGGTHKSEANSYSYKLHYNCQNAPAYFQVGWKYCTKCKVLYWCEKSCNYGPYQCPAGGAHTPGPSIYGLMTQTDYSFGPIQDNWGYCGKCMNLFHDPEYPFNVCNWDGQYHDGSVSSQYYLVH